MSQWTHPICDDCWNGLFPGREPYRVDEFEEVHCCVCGDLNISGIYFREDPNMLPAHHQHEDDD